MHFVNLRFKPAEKSTDSVPALVRVIVVGVCARAFLAVNDKLLIGFRQLLEWDIDVDLLPGAGPEQIFLRFAKFLTAENADHALFDRQ